eukprot:GHVS01029634.1.p1 GENE.GHVS01029634.1~~GHVS01029634.1.p1  ORF type:complete len:248 (-),score=36.99 GHVS01029634.1:557-1192(-)
MLWYFWVGYNPGYLVPSEESRNEEEERRKADETKNDSFLHPMEMHSTVTTNVDLPSAASAAEPAVWSHHNNSGGGGTGEEEGGKARPVFLDVFGYGLDDTDLPLEEFRSSVSMLAYNGNDGEDSGVWGREGNAGGQRVGTEQRSGVGPEVIGLPVSLEDTSGVIEQEQNTEDPDLPGYCRVCHIPQPLRCHHCRECNHCVLTFDHHCFFIG